MSQAEEDRYEYERLIAMGRSVPKPNCPRVEAIAMAMDPSLWSTYVQKEIEDCTAYNLLDSETHYGAQFQRKRTILRIRAMEALRALERNKAGLPPLTPFDPLNMASKLEKQALDFHFENDRLNFQERVPVDHEPARSVSLLKEVYGIPAPVPHLARNGVVTLTWNEGRRSACLNIKTRKEVLLTLTSEETSRGFPLNITEWYEVKAWRILTEATDWVYHGGPFPHIDNPGSPTKTKSKG